jgi:hypothetical protein
MATPTRTIAFSNTAEMYKAFGFTQEEINHHYNKCASIICREDLIKVACDIYDMQPNRRLLTGEIETERKESIK